MEQIDPIQDQKIENEAPAPDHGDCAHWDDL